MDMFYEQDREENVQPYVITDEKFEYPPHFHINQEVFMLRHGSFRITLNGKSHLLGDGDIAVFDSYDVHSYDENLSGDELDGCVIVFSRLNCARFSQEKGANVFVEKIVNNPQLCGELIDLAQKMQSVKGERTLDATVGLFIAILCDNFKLSPTENSDGAELIRKILVTIHDNYRRQITLASISKGLGYTPEHISRVFHSYMHCGIPVYINSLRLRYVENQYKKGGKITQIIYEGGFNSLETYYRTKRKTSSKSL